MSMHLPSSGKVKTGAHEFNFIYGRFDVHHRKILDHSDPNCVEWVEFASDSNAFPVLGELGQVHVLHAANPPDGDPFAGLTLRLYDPVARTWSIWWSSTRSPGVLDSPLVGRFDGTNGVFRGSVVVAGRPVEQRCEWFADLHAPRWEQFFSWDGGRTWIKNWIMTFERDPGFDR